MSKVFALHLMRHGRPEGAGRLIGHADTAPLPEGIALCQRRAEALDFADLVCSDLARAAHAANVIGAVRGLSPRCDPRWRELAFGRWENCDPTDLPQEDLMRFHDDPEGAAPPGGERWSVLCARVAAALEDIARPALVVTHAGAMRAALAVLLGLNCRQTWTFDLPYGALISLRIWPGEHRSAQIAGLAA